MAQNKTKSGGVATTLFADPIQTALVQWHSLPGSISVSGQLPTYLSPNPTLTLTFYQLTVVGLGEG